METLRQANTPIWCTIAGGLSSKQGTIISLQEPLWAVRPREPPLALGSSPGSWGTAPTGQPGRTCGIPGTTLPALERFAATPRRNGPAIK